ncbi:MAG: hypothetical protein IT290_07515 [Deltaproteobacteria bacterium]|nr:hypothetical protein [Deltaproteobacteria bacterium]
MLFGWLGLFWLVIIFGWLGMKFDDRRELVMLVDRMNTLFGAQWLNAAKVAAASQSSDDREAERTRFLTQMDDIANLLGRDVKRLQHEVYFWTMYQEAEPDYPLKALSNPEVFRAFEAQGHRILAILSRLERRAKDAKVEYPPSFAYYLRARIERGGLPLSINEETLTFSRFIQGWRDEVRLTCDAYRTQVDLPRASVAR